jgi:RecA-family ATPase
MPSAMDILALHVLPEPVIPALTPAPPLPKPKAIPRVDNVMDRARKYIDRMPPAIEGQNGSGAALAVARVLINDFALSHTEAKAIFEEYNFRCRPMWSDKEIEHKLASAAVKVAQGDCQTPRGGLLAKESEAPAVTYRLKPKPAPIAPVGSLPDDEIPMRMADVYAFNPDKDPNSILGRRFVCRGGSLMMIGSSGIGKSTISVQMALTWSMGLPFFGILPSGSTEGNRRYLKSMIIQAENDAGDVHEMIQGVSLGLGIDLSSLERQAYVDEHLILLRQSTKTGPEFLDYAHRMITRHQPDLVFADPLLSYIGGDISKQEICGKFLRNGLNPILLDTGAAWVWCHHTNKPPKDNKAFSAWTDMDYNYIGAGSADLTNWARAIGVITKASKSEKIFRLGFTKRGARSGMLDLNGQKTEEIFVRHSQQENVLHWEQCSFDDQESTKTVYKTKGNKAEAKYSEICDRLKETPMKYSELIKVIMAVCECGITTAKTTHFPRMLVQCGIKKSDDQIALYSWSE